MFSTFRHRLFIQLWRFSMFWQNTFKVVCCRIVVWGKGLNESTIIESSWKHGDKMRNCSFCAISFFVIIFSKKPSAVEALETVYMRERVIIKWPPLSVSVLLGNWKYNYDTDWKTLLEDGQWLLYLRCFSPILFKMKILVILFKGIKYQRTG